MVLPSATEGDSGMRGASISWHVVPFNTPDET
jgi:hypothetical protein